MMPNILAPFCPLKNIEISMKCILDYPKKVSLGYYYFANQLRIVKLSLI